MDSEIKKNISEKNKEIPSEFICPIRLTIMQDPVMTSDGHTFERTAIQAWIEQGKVTNPLTNLPLKSGELIPNRVLKSLIADFQEKGEKEETPANPYADVEEKKQQQQVDKKKQVKPKSELDLRIEDFEARWRDFENDSFRQIQKFREKEREFPEIAKYDNGYYSGEIQCGQHYGIGKMVFNSGNIELGEWKNNLLDGNGYIFQRQKRRSFCGRFQQGFLNGYGQLKDQKSKTIVYRGEWKNGSRDGFGIENDEKTKKIYMGQWRNNKKHGVGRQFNFIGDFYEGVWKDGIKQGEGIRQKTNGSTIKEFWADGKEFGDQKSYIKIHKKEGRCCTIF